MLTLWLDLQSSGGRREVMSQKTIDLILSSEKTFNVYLPDDECTSLFTVGDLYRLILRKLELPYISECELRMRLWDGRPGV